MASRVEPDTSQSSGLVRTFVGRFCRDVLLRFRRQLALAGFVPAWLAMAATADVILADAARAVAGPATPPMIGESGVGTPRPQADESAEVRIGQQLFFERRFAQAFAATTAELNGEPPPPAMSCATCHVPPGGAGSAGTPRAFCDAAMRSAVPDRGDGRVTTPRNSPSLIDALAGPAGGLLHYDGEFATPEALVAETYTGRNFGWRPAEGAAARHHFATVIRQDDGRDALAVRCGGFSYARLLRGTAVPDAWRLPPDARVDVATATDDEIVAACSRLVVAYLRTLRFSRDANGAHNGSPYDAFLAANRLPRSPATGETPREYSRRLSELVFALASPRFVDDPVHSGGTEHRPFRFGETELRGLKIFFKAAVGNAQRSGAGNCAECHLPPHFSDFKFHNTGVAQDEYDALHGAGAFARVVVPTLEERSADYDRWLQPTPMHPRAHAAFLRPASVDAPDGTDLGVWNVYANPDLPGSQAALERIVNPARRRTREEALASLVAAFKTPGLRDLDDSAPYLHTGRAATLDEVGRFYQRMSELAHAGEMRNAPPEFFAMRLGESDIIPLVAFLRSLDEDLTGTKR